MRDSIPCWQKILAQGFATAAELLRFLHIPNEEGCDIAEKQFKTRVPRGFAERMQRGNRNDPLLLQVLATQKELQITPGFTHDPLKEITVNPLQGLIHKYHGRVLLTLTGACAINCRYCFRRHFPYHDNNPGRAGWQSVIGYIDNDPSIHEVILSGGDPLLAKDVILMELIEALGDIPHLRSLRIHTRMPIVLPERIQHDLLQLLAASRLHKIVVLHTNHPQEINATVEKACLSLRAIGCHLLNQSVLLAGINDDAEVLTELSERLFACGVLPYYLHLLDKVQGTAHFDIPHAEALALFHQLQRRLPGYLVPRLAREEPGQKNKILFV
jgi:EF-P beta-lysylation protein EpmB